MDFTKIYIYVGTVIQSVAVSVKLCWPSLRILGMKLSVDRTELVKTEEC